MAQRRPPAGGGAWRAGPMTAWAEPTREAIAAAADGIVAAPREVPAAVLERIGEQVFRIAWIGHPGEAEDERLDYLYSYWDNLRHGDSAGLARIDRVDPLDMPKALGNILLLDAVDGGFDARYRIYGTNVAERSGHDWSGVLVSEMNRRTRTPYSLFYRATYRAVFVKGAPLFSHHASPTWVSSDSWRRLILPIFDAAGRCARFLVGNFPVGHRALSEEARRRQAEILGKRQP